MNDLVLEQMQIAMKFLNLALDMQGIDDRKNTFEYLRNAEQTLSQAILLRKRTLYGGEE